MPRMPTKHALIDDHGIDLPVANLAVAEANAIRALAEWLATPEGQGAGRVEMELWMVERGWQPGKLQAWAERIAAEQALADPRASDPMLIHAKLNQRFERLALRAESMNDIKHAVAASEAQAKLNKLGGFAPQAGATVAIQVNASTAHLASDDDLARIAKQAKPVEIHEPLAD